MRHRGEFEVLFGPLLTACGLEAVRYASLQLSIAVDKNEVPHKSMLSNIHELVVWLSSVLH
jgi:hypothetical protein